jgi:outer membrane protein OmpA-like peptidoglycan-associated protein
MSRFSNGLWSEPENLGATINTVFDEEAPYLHYDGKTLYFSSNGHPGYGSSDLFLSRKETKNGATVWTKPVNMGSGINTSEDELGLYVDRKGAQAYFVSTREGGFGGPDIYTFDMSKSKQPAAVSFVRGLVFDNDTKKEIYGRIEILDLNSGEVLLSDSSPYFFTTLTPGGNYAMNVYRKGYLFYSENFQPTGSNVDSPFQISAYLKPLKNNQILVLKNIFFDLDKFDLKKESYAELAVVIELLAKNPGISIEISGHTDNYGIDEYNQQLSENRANAVKQYLVSKGAAAGRISTKGLGATQPIDSNDTESGRANNRRIEMKIVGTGQ